MKDHYPVTNLPGELEQPHEALPTKPIEQQWFAVEDMGSTITNVPKDGYDAHEGLVVRRNPKTEKVEIAADTDGLRQRLGTEGYVKAFGTGVPFTGANNGERFSSGAGGGRKLMTEIAANLVASGNGLRTPDFEAMSDEQREELRALDMDYPPSAGTGWRFGGKGALEVSRASSIDPSTEEGLARLKQVGTFSRIDVPFANNPGRGYEAYAVTDEFGNQVIAPSCEALAENLATLGYSETEEPAFTHVPDRRPMQNLGEYNLGERVMARSLSDNKRLQTKLVDLKPENS